MMREESIEIVRPVASPLSLHVTTTLNTRSRPSVLPYLYYKFTKRPVRWLDVRRSFRARQKKPQLKTFGNHPGNHADHGKTHAKVPMMTARAKNVLFPNL
jgi:hypothetical protein